MREIKFRAYHTESKEMLFGSLKEIGQWLEEKQPIEVMEAIGLNVKGGVQVFEKDILKHNDNIYVVSWTKNFGFCLIHKKHYNEYPDTVMNISNRREFVWAWSAKKYIEVIGNIHENPELLTK